MYDNRIPHLNQFRRYPLVLYTCKLGLFVLCLYLSHNYIIILKYTYFKITCNILRLKLFS